MDKPGSSNENRYNKLKNLFLKQSYIDSWSDYERSLHERSFIKWDYIVLTASNTRQAEAFEIQLDHRLKAGKLPKETHYAVLPDPEGERVGSGGATFNVLKYVAECENKKGKLKNIFENLRVLVIHSGGDSKRVPQYSAVGKLFSPVPRELPDGRGSTLFDELIIALSAMPSRIKDGMLILSGDVLLLFNPLQMDIAGNGAVAISFKELAEVGKEHGVFLDDGRGYVKKFLHKLSVERLKSAGAVNEHGMVDLDTGAILFNTDILDALYSLISDGGRPDQEKFGKYVNSRARISFYGDFLYPLASDSTLENFYKEQPEGAFTEELHECRKGIWEVLHDFSMKLICLSPARFIHFGTTRELSELMNSIADDLEFLDWKSSVLSTALPNPKAAAYCSYVGRRAALGERVYLENSYILDETTVGEGSIVSALKLRNVHVPENVVLHCLPVDEDKFVVRIYGIGDNPKSVLEDGAELFGRSLKEFLDRNSIAVQEIWAEGQPHDLWNARLYPITDKKDEAVHEALRVYDMMTEPSAKKGRELVKKERLSLSESFLRSDVVRALEINDDLENRVLSRIFTDSLLNGDYYEEALETFRNQGINPEIYSILMDDADNADFSLKIRIYYALSRYMKKRMAVFNGRNYEYPESLCFSAIRDAVYENALKLLPERKSLRIARDEVNIALPVRVNWGGGWTDTPPYCNENGGVVLNAAISLNGILPVQITVRKIKEYRIEFESQDVGVKGVVTDIAEIQKCNNPYDQFALHKAALIACGVIPLSGGSLEELLKELGGGIYLSTQVVGVPKGSGLGTSSILAAACVKGIFEFLGIGKTDNEIYGIVLCMEQLMSTGGGWQDQVGGLTPGIKFISSRPGFDQTLTVEKLNISEEAMQELNERFALIYTGQRRLARNLLRDVIGRYIGGRTEAVDALREMKPTAALMRFYLERGDIDAFAGLLDRHWELSRQLDAGSTNSCIDQIFISCQDLIDARFIAGAGGGGFIMVILKKGITKDMLRDRISAIFQNSGVEVWESSFV